MLPVAYLQVLLSGFLGFGISLCYSTLNKITSATTITTANNFNKILTTIIGSVLYSERTTMGAGVGLFTSMSGIVMYGYVQKGRGGLPLKTALVIIVAMLAATILLVTRQQ